MAESSRETQSKKPESEKKQAETVQLTSEELKAIAGGAGFGTTGPSSKDVTAGKKQ